MAVEVEPEQPEPVAAALAELLAAAAEPPRSAWWQAGQAEALET